MILISHRGNITGPNPKLENKPSYILDALNKGYDCEIDVYYDRGWWLGHDAPQYKIDIGWLCGKKDVLWIHCKNTISLYKMLKKMYIFNCFSHQNDIYTLTSKGYIWQAHYNNITDKTIVVDKSKKIDINKKCYAICADYLI